MMALWCAAVSLPAQTKPDDTPATVRTSITVVEHIEAETPANITTLSGAQLEQIPGDNLDDRLRSIPGFSLFRRSSSVVANPTTQGVSLRGIGSSGASRTLVLFDGVPMNDPFGGWVYWSRFTPSEMRRVEVSRGAATSVFGDLAMSGSLALFPQEPDRNRYSAGYEGGNRNTHDAWGDFTRLWNHLAVSTSARAYSTDGYFVVATPLRGGIDREAGVRFASGTVRVDGFAGRQRLFGEWNGLAEERANGTYITHNSTGLGTASLHYLYQAPHDGFSVVGFRSQGQYHATFSAITNNRNTERLTSSQTVPSEATGGSVIYNHAATRWNAVAGADLNNEHGFSTDHFPGTAPTVRRAGGTLFEHGVFVQGDARIGALRVFGGGRQETAAHRQYFNPSGGLVLGSSRWRARGTVYRSFRAPSLNELYRDFRAGNTLTQANAALRPETLSGGEAGADFIGETGSVRVTAFHNSLERLITNVTLSSTKTLITRQRRNAAAATAEGVEIEARQQWRNWSGEASYLYASSRYSTGPYIAQVPRHQGSAELAYQRGRASLSTGLRAYSYQFDDDLNRFRLPGFATVQLMAREQLTASLAGVASIENLLDHQFLTGFTPTPTIGAPRLWRLGLLWKR